MVSELYFQGEDMSSNFRKSNYWEDLLITTVFGDINTSKTKKKYYINLSIKITVYIRIMDKLIKFKDYGGRIRYDWFLIYQLIK